MKAKDLKKQSLTIEQIHKQIEDSNDRGDFKTFIPHFVFVEESTKIQLMNEGFKCYKSDWDAYMIEAFTIEW